MIITLSSNLVIVSLRCTRNSKSKPLTIRSNLLDTALTPNNGKKFKNLEALRTEGP